MIENIGKYQLEVSWKEDATVEQMQEAQSFVKETLEAMEKDDGTAFPDCIQSVKIARA